MVLGSEAELQVRAGGDPHLNLRDLALGYLKQAQVRIADASNAQLAGNHAYALRLSQECVEFCVKASLRSVAIEYPKVHEVSGLLQEFQHRFPPWFRDEVVFIQSTSVSLFKKRELAFYGGEDTALPPDKVISAEDGKNAVQSAEKVFSLAKRLLAKSK